MDRQEVGRQGEALAASFLSDKGMRLLGRNVRTTIGEIDLLMQDCETIVVVEVKSLSRKGAIDPIYKIDAAKQAKLWKLARQISARNPEQNVRIDAVTLYWEAETPVLTHYKNIITKS